MNNLGVGACHACEPRHISDSVRGFGPTGCGNQSRKGADFMPTGKGNHCGTRDRRIGVPNKTAQNGRQRKIAEFAELGDGAEPASQLAVLRFAGQLQRVPLD